MICNFCGNKIDDASEFCVICGQNADGKKEANEDVFSQKKQDESVETKEKETKDKEEATTEEATTEVAEKEVVDTKEIAEEDKTDKKSKKEKTKKKKVVGSFMKFLCFISTIISFFTYRKAVKKGNEERQEAVMNLLGLSICWKLAYVVYYLLTTYVI